MLIVIATCAAFSLCASAINTYYRDARHAMPFILQLILYLSPVLYPLSLVPEEWRLPYSILNPLAGSIDGFRQIVLHGGMAGRHDHLRRRWRRSSTRPIAYLAFKRVERGFTDRV